MEEITQELAQEYREVAALVCFELDMIKDMSDEGLTAEEYKGQINLLHEKKEDWIKNPEYRKMMYDSTSLLFSLPRSTEEE
jgi:hypothetical protein